MQDLLRNLPVLLVILTFILGLMVGSFLNVVIYRLPVMMQRGWRRECLEFLQLPAEQSLETFNLLWPGSRCPVCKTDIKAYQNIPVLSYLLLGGKCGHCATPISPRYPLIEIFSGICSALMAWHFGYSLAMLGALLLTWGLIALSFIDIDQQLLPDSITLPMLWMGLFLSLFSLYTDSQASIIGAVAGYLSLWSVYHLFKLLTGKEGMGHGDFKLLAMLGAWLGWQYLPLIILLSSLVGAVIGIAMILFKRHDASRPIPFGPYLAAAGWLALIWGGEINRLYLNMVGL
ncbi:prepilin peptidase [Methylomonas sp. LL1]|uniref:prepilin peptidase n=1 Tax=Methylomonas sp. LL1 TaxID=2785785 RepID=UPI0018C40B93|nr:A24 family peptidase [Methylomonas sp. LL1]QPK62967.1 prepilin peptidase [Methylomonas sp. LL1]